MPKPTDAEVRDLMRVLTATGAVRIPAGRENAVIRQFQTLMGSVDAFSAVPLTSEDEPAVGFSLDQGNAGARSSSRPAED